MPSHNSRRRRQRESLLLARVLTGRGRGAVPCRGKGGVLAGKEPAEKGVRRRGGKHRRVQIVKLARAP